MRRYFIIAVGGTVLFKGGSIFGTSSVPSKEVFKLASGDDGLSLESGDCESSDSCGTGFQNGARSTRTTDENEGPLPKKARYSKGVPKAQIEQRIEKFFKKHPCTPISNICKTQQWLADSDFRYLRDNHQKFQVVMDVLSNELIPFSIRQFTEMYRRPGCQPLFAMPRGINEILVKKEVDGVLTETVLPYYLDETGSLEIVTQLLEFQTKGRVKEFLTDLVNILDKRVPKLNSMFVYAPPSSGKNFFFDFVLNFFLIRGQLMNIRKGESFPYMDCVDRRVILFNEPNICESPSTMDTLKMLFGGDFCPAAVKFKAPTIIHRTPVFILTNDSMLFRNVPAFSDRMIRLEWEPAPFLKHVGGYPNPIVLPNLLEKYNVEY